MMIRSVLILFFIMMQFSELHAAEAVSIGAVLPLSGKFAAFGNKALQGAELALERYNSTASGKKSPAKLLIKDSQGVPAAAEKAVMELDKEGVSAIIGPILGITSDVAAKKAQELGIPIITMTQKEGLPDTGEWVFRNCLTNAAQVKGLVEYAVKDGVKRVAVLYPDNQYGKELSDLFNRRISAMGGSVVVSRSYKEGQTDFGAEVKALLRPDPSKKQKGANGPVFDAVFIPDYYERVGLIIPQLIFYDIKDVKILGISGWNSPRLVSMAGDYMKNAVFVDGFFSGSERPHVKEFVELYKNTFGEEPGLLEAQAYDTMGILLSLISDNAYSRERVRGGLLKVKDYRGVSGDITFDGRDADRTVYILTVKNGKIEEISSQ